MHQRLRRSATRQEPSLRSCLAQTPEQRRGGRHDALQRRAVQGRLSDLAKGHVGHGVERFLLHLQSKVETQADGSADFVVRDAYTSRATKSVRLLQRRAHPVAEDDRSEVICISDGVGGSVVGVITWGFRQHV